MTALYTLFATGDDNDSTYAECWGQTATSAGRLVAQAATLIGLIGAVDALGHDNFWVRGPGGRYIAGSRKAFRALPSVAKELQRLSAAE